MVAVKTALCEHPSIAVFDSLCVSLCSSPRCPNRIASRRVFGDEADGASEDDSAATADE
jgi:hypothetical protein